MIWGFLCDNTAALQAIGSLLSGASVFAFLFAIRNLSLLNRALRSDTNRQLAQQSV
jgi:hypothetical protein